MMADATGCDISAPKKQKLINMLTEKIEETSALNDSKPYYYKNANIIS